MCVSKSYSLSRWQAIKTKHEPEFCAADCRAGRLTISPGKCNGTGIALPCTHKVGEGIFPLATAEAARVGDEARERDER